MAVLDKFMIILEKVGQMFKYLKWGGTTLQGDPKGLPYYFSGYLGIPVFPFPENDRNLQDLKAIFKNLGGSFLSERRSRQTESYSDQYVPGSHCCNI